MQTMSQRRYIVVDPEDLRETESLDGTEACPVPLIGRCITAVFYCLRPSRRPLECDPTTFSEPVFNSIELADEQRSEEVVDSLVEKRPLRLMSTAVISTPDTTAPMDIPDSKRIQNLEDPYMESDSGSSTTTKISDSEDEIENEKFSLQELQSRPQSEQYEWFRKVMGWA